MFVIYRYARESLTTGKVYQNIPVSLVCFLKLTAMLSVFIVVLLRRLELLKIMQVPEKFKCPFC